MDSGVGVKHPRTMLIGIDARMTPDLLYCLARMGHGDELVLADTNFPAVSTARHCTVPEPIQLAGIDAAGAAEVVTALMPLDDFTENAAWRMEVDGAPDRLTDAHAAVFAVLKRATPPGAGLGSLARPAFYERANRAFAVVHCTETGGFGCFILRKGVVLPAGG